MDYFLPVSIGSGDRGAPLTDNVLHFGDQAAGGAGASLLREVTGVQHIIHHGPVFTVVEKLILLGVLIEARKMTK